MTDLFACNEELMTMRLLAERMRPCTIAAYIGQEHIVGAGKLLHRAIEADSLFSMILYGPPGCGKTTLAMIIAQHTKGEFVRLHAVDASVKDVRAIIAQASMNQNMYHTKTVLFLDEVHRFNRAQQDVLLSAVERGTIIFIGATTENPFYHVNGALLSRATLFQLQPLTKTHVLIALQRALTDKKDGLGCMPIQVEKDVLHHLATIINGDIRRALNVLEMSALHTSPAKDGIIYITQQIIEQSVSQAIAQVDQSVQYDVLSAFHKSIRGSSDAALFWFFYAVEKLGMDPLLFMRRLTIACSEDIGLANPQAMVQAVSACDAYQRIGWPEAKYMIAQAILFAVESPKSNSIPLAIERVMQALTEVPVAEVPLHLRDTHYKQAANKLGHTGYQYPHHYPGHYVEQQYLPDKMKRHIFFIANEQGIEAKMRRNQEQRKRE